MSNDRWQHIEDIFHRAVEMAPEARAAFLSDVCGADESLRQEVESLLAHDSEDGSTFAGAAVLQVSGTGQPLMTGRTISHYEIIERLGQGGMGVVYKARDNHLKRFVALKVLPPEKVADSGRKQRFVQEARSASALNHPNIVTVYDIDQSDGIDFIAMEYVEGKTLDDLIGGKGLKRNETLKYGVQIADALAKAHAAGIVHRDIKPGNVMVTGEGRVKVLDFGLAKLTEAAPPNSQGSTFSEYSSAGLIVGTVGYMSPEQADGKKVDARSDIFSLGVILYEMLSGQRAFHRDSVIETLNAILKEDPPPLEDAALERIVRRCLEKSPEQRFQSASDLGFAIAGLTGSSTVTAPPAAAIPSRRSLAWPVLMALALAVGAAGGWWWQLQRESSAPGWTGVQLGGPSMAIAPRLSPDDRTLAFVAVVDGQAQLAVMNPVSSNWRVLTHERSAGTMGTVSWSRDGTRIYFDRWIRGGNIHSVPSLGGDDRLVLEDAFRPEVLPDGSLIVMRVNPEGEHQVHRFWPATGNIQALPFLSSPVESYWGMRAFADGQEVAVLGRPLVGSQVGTPGAYALDLKSLRTRRLLPFTEFQEWQVLVPSADGRSVFTGVRTGNLYRVVMGDRDGSGSPRTALTLTNPLFGLDVAADGSLYTTQTEISLEVLRFPVGGGVAEKLVEATIPFQPRYLLQLPDGRFLFQGFPAGRSRLLVADRGKDPIPLVETEEITAQPMALLGDRQVALLAGSDSDSLGVAVADLSNGRIVRRLARTKGLQIQSLASSPDGKTLYYGAGGGIWSIPAEDGEARKLTRGNAIAVDPHGQELVVQRDEKDGIHLYRLALQGGAEERIPFPGPLYLHGWSIASNAIHGDGRIVVLAYSPDSYWNQIVILDPKTGKAERVPVQHSGDILAPSWTRDGRILAVGSPLKSTLWRFFRK